MADSLVRISEFTACWLGETVFEAVRTDWEGWATDISVTAASPTLCFLQFLPTGLECCMLQSRQKALAGGILDKNTKKAKIKT